MKQEEKKIPLYLENIVENINDNILLAKWQGFDFNRFSKDKTLFAFQKQGLQNALKGLWLYFKGNTPSAVADTPLQEGNKLKQSLFNHYQANDFTENFDYNLNRERKAAKYLLEYPEDYPIVDNKISFAHFINRISFWMATGSGKTLIIWTNSKIIFLKGFLPKKKTPKNILLAAMILI